jgi:drug/metabolite transporter (DMT)-like permease
MPLETGTGAGRSMAFGYACGVAMACGAAISFVAARSGILAGLGADDMIFARFVVAGLVALPAVLYWGLGNLAGIGWWRGAALVLTAGPPFALLQTGGYAFAPLAHGAVIAPSTVTILSTIAAGLLLGERLTRAHVVGAALVLSGIVAIAWQGLVSAGDGSQTWIGDLLFVVSSMLWVAFTLLIRIWRVDAIRATGVVAVISMCTMTPAYLIFRGVDHLAALPLAPLIVQGLVQGIVQAILTVMAYSRAIAILGVSRAVLFPAMVPAVSVVIGIPLIGEIPTTMQIAGLGLVSVGMMIAVGLFRRRPPSPKTGA